MGAVFYQTKETELVANQSWFRKLKSFLTRFKIELLAKGQQPPLLFQTFEFLCTLKKRKDEENRPMRKKVHE